MDPLARASVATAALTALSAAAAPSDPAHRTVTVVRTSPTLASDMSAVCPAGTLPDFDQCIPIPDDVPTGSSLDLVGERNVHRDRSGRWITYEQIPKLPERPADYDAYRYPVPPPESGHFAVSGYDLDRPDNEQRRGSRLSHTGHGAVDLMHTRGTEVRTLPLEHQQGDAEVLFVGKLFGISVVTRHTLREGGRLRDYIVLYGHLDASAEGIAPGMIAREGDLLGYVGDTGSEGIVHLHLEVRQVRDNIDPADLRNQNVVRNQTTIPCDPRNVLPLK
ncbi:MAG TPA: M23 family metallopeptidase [Polyangiaceae bacterium]|nr:M23 family metallopeptidase [Polyangiaceae bacterium]